MTGLYRLFLISSIILLISTGCSPESCYEDRDALMKGVFYETGTGLSLPADSLTIVSLPSGNLIFYSKTLKAASFDLLLDPASDESTFLITVNGIKDTITINSSSFPWLISKECGFAWNHKINSAITTRNIIDTIIIRQSNVTTTDEENLRIFY